MELNENKTALIADDNAGVRMLFSRVLKSINIEIVAEAANGNEAIDMYFETNPTVMLLDIMMPGKSGTEVLKEIMQDDPDACILMMSSINDEEVAEKCFDLGAEGYLQKNASLNDIRQTILAVTEQKL